MIPAVINHAHLFCGIGGGAKGFNAGEARVGNLRAEFHCIGGIDCDPGAITDFGHARRAGVWGTVMDLFDREQYRDFHGREPGREWREATPDDVRRAYGYQHPHILFLSAPCKGFSGLLSESRSKSDKYRALNRLTLRGIWLVLEAYKDDPVELILFENVPRIRTRGRYLMDQIVGLLRQYGYAVAETAHDCGELGGLAPSRKRFLLVARYAEKVPNFLYEPVKRPLRAVGDVLERLPLPGCPTAGPMHRMPALQWKTWVRLAFVEAGGDWRSLNRLRVADGMLADYGIIPEREMRPDCLGVLGWGDRAGTVTSRGFPHNGKFSVADPRCPGMAEYAQYGVLPWSQACGAVSAQSAPGGGRYSVADPRVAGVRHNNVFRVVRFLDTSPAVTGGTGPSAGGMAVADPRPQGQIFGKYAVTSYREPAGTVIAGSTTGQGAFAVADPRPGLSRRKGDAYYGGGHYGVVPWYATSGAVSSAASCDSGRWSVADPRPAQGEAWELPALDARLVAVIRAEDGTWHRPFTTLELAALQGLVDPDEQFELDGLSDAAWRERIGNAVPPPSAKAIADVMGTTLLLAWSGETFTLGSTPIWVRPVAAALMAARQ